MNSPRLIRFEHSIDAPLEQVQALLFSIRPGDFTYETAPVLLLGYAPLSIRAEANGYVAAYSGGKIHITIDNLSISVAGAWWYKSIIQLSPNGHSTLITNEIHNGATSNRWVVRWFIWNSKTEAASLHHFNHLVQLIKNKLHK